MQSLKFISEAYRKGMLSHAYIIEGAGNSGKEQFAQRIAAALLCEQTRPKEPLFPEMDGSGLHGRKVPCGRCPSCIKAATGNHPDIRYVRHEKETVLSVGEVREQIVSDISIKPYYGPYKIYIVPDAQLMNENAQNALLKTIEEPAEYGLILLLTDNSDGFLQTIRSRCIRLTMDVVPRQQTARALMDDDGLKVLEILQAAADMDAVRIQKSAREFESYDRQQVLMILQLWMRDVLVMKSAGPAAELYFPESRESLRRYAGASYEGINRMSEAVYAAGSRIRASVKAEAAYEALLLSLRREL